MKIRALTITLNLSFEDFNFDGDNIIKLNSKLTKAKGCLDYLQSVFENLGYVVQTIRVSLNSFEEWSKLSESDPYKNINYLVAELDKLSIDFCSIGATSCIEAIKLIPSILAISPRLNTSVCILPSNSNTISLSSPAIPSYSSSSLPDINLCHMAAQTCLEVANMCGDLGNFRYCTSFNCPSGIPFFPSAFSGKNESKCPTISIGLESGDLLFLGFFGSDSLNEGRDNLLEILKQVLKPIENIIIDNQQNANKLGFDYEYGGIDASINPGLTLPDSVGAGLESMLKLLPLSANSQKKIEIETGTAGEKLRQFGSFGTLAVVSAVTSAIKTIQYSGEIKLIGYSGLMLPVMEDLILAERASQIPSLYTLRDLLIFSSVCGVGLDTIPIPGDSDVESLTAIYTEVGALSFRLNKPLTCRLLPMKGKNQGDLTDVNSPFLCNTRVFSIE